MSQTCPAGQKTTIISICKTANCPSLSYPYFQRLLHRLALLEDLVLLGHDVVEAGGEGLHVHPGTGHVAGADHRAVAVTGVGAEKKICSLFLERYLLMTLSAFSDIDCFI